MHAKAKSLKGEVVHRSVQVQHGQSSLDHACMSPTITLDSYLSLVTLNHPVHQCIVTRHFYIALLNVLKNTLSSQKECNYELRVS